MAASCCFHHGRPAGHNLGQQSKSGGRCPTWEVAPQVHHPKEKPTSRRECSSLGGLGSFFDYNHATTVRLVVFPLFYSAAGSRSANRVTEWEALPRCGWYRSGRFSVRAPWVWTVCKMHTRRESGPPWSYMSLPAILRAPRKANRVGKCRTPRPPLRGASAVHCDSLGLQLSGRQR